MANSKLTIHSVARATVESREREDARWITFRFEDDRGDSVDVTVFPEDADALLSELRLQITAQASELA